MRNNIHSFFQKPLMALVLFGAMIALTGTSCNNKKNSPKAATTKNLIDPSCNQGSVNATRTWTMPPELVEISGITWIDNERVAAIQDEQGIIFIYNLQNETVEKKINFGQAGDYEGISLVNQHYFVIRSDGHMFEVDGSGKIVNQYDLPLSTKDNIESFYFDAANNRLLIGQKDGDKAAGRKEIYGFDLASRKFNTEPVYTLDLSNPVITCENNLASIKEYENGNTSKKKKNRKNHPELRPSDLAINPGTKEIYIVDGPNQRILVLSTDGRPKHFLALDKQVFPKAEGLMFSPGGEMYVSSEGVTNAGNISKVSITMN